MNPGAVSSSPITIIIYTGTSITFTCMPLYAMHGYYVECTNVRDFMYISQVIYVK